MTIFSPIVDRLKGNPLVAGGAVITLAAGVAQALQGHPSALAVGTAVAPLVGGFLAQFFTVPWSEVKPLADQAAQLAGQVAPSSKAWATMLGSALDAAAAQSAATGFPVPIGQSPTAPPPGRQEPTGAEPQPASPLPADSTTQPALAPGWSSMYAPTN